MTAELTGKRSHLDPPLVRSYEIREYALLRPNRAICGNCPIQVKGCQY